jgi:hypothetical protein
VEKENMSYGYKAITPIKLLNGVSAYSSGAISFKALRVYLSCLELEAIREAAKRSNKAKARRGSNIVCFRKEELISLTNGLSLRSIGKSIKELETASLMYFSKERIVFTETPTNKASRELIEETLSGRKGTRSIPVPRRLIKLLGGLTKPALFLTLIGYILRGLSIDRKTGLVNSRGTVKASWIADAFGLSLRAVKNARAELVSLGIISKDVNSYQRKLNRHGAYFELNLEWSKAGSREEKEAETVDNFATSCTEFAPPKAQKCTEFAPPIIKLITSKENKNHKTRNSNPAGFCNQNFKKGELPNIKNIQPKDFKEFSRNEILYWQAVELGLIIHSEANVLNWVSASIRARETDNPARIFMGIIKKKLFNHVTQAQEEIARNAINRRREKHFDAYRVQSQQKLAA